MVYMIANRLSKADGDDGAPTGRPLHVRYRSGVSAAAGRARGLGICLGVVCVGLSLVGCGTSPSPAASLQPDAGEVGEVVTADVTQPVERRADASPRERWLSPFAVAASGSVSRPEPREVLISGSDPVIARGLAEQRAIDLAADPPDPDRDSAAPDFVRTDTTSAAGAATARGGAPETDTGGGRGNAPAPDFPERPSQAESEAARTHRVQFGETWLGIANRYGVPARTLALENPGVDAERIRVGQVLRLPAAASSTREHRVGPGDTLSELAELYGVSSADIRRANGITDDRIRLGQTLVIPGR